MRRKRIREEWGERETLVKAQTATRGGKGETQNERRQEKIHSRIFEHCIDNIYLPSYAHGVVGAFDNFPRRGIDAERAI